MADQKLTAKLGLDTSEYDRNLDKAQRGAEGFGTGLKGIAGKISGAFAAITGVAIFSKQVIQASEVLNDKFSFAVKGAKEAVWEFFNMTARGDFDNFINNLIEGYRRARDLADQFDRLKDASAYTSYETSGLRATRAELTEIVRDSSGKYTISQRKKAAEELKKVAQEIQDTELAIAEKTFELEKKAWEGRNKMNAEEAAKLYQTIYGTSKEQLTALENVFKYETGLFGFEKGIKGILEGGKSAGTLSRAGVTREQIESYAKYLELNRGEEDVFVKLFAILQQKQEAIKNGQIEYNSVLRITNSLLGEQTGKSGKEAALRNTGFSDIPYADIKHLSPNQGLMPYGPEKIDADIYKLSEMEDALISEQQAVNMLSDAFMELFQGSEDGFRNMIDSMIQGIEQLVAEILAKKLVSLIGDYFGGSGSFVSGIKNIVSNATGSLGGTPSGVSGKSMDYLNVSGEISGRDIKLSNARW